MNEDMSTHKRKTISLHPNELEKLKRIATIMDEDHSGAIMRLIIDADEQELKKKYKKVE